MRARTADTATNRRRGRLSESPRLRSVLMLMAVTVLFLAIFILPDLLKPDQAQAIDIPVVSDVADAAKDLIGEGAEKLGESALGPIKDAFLWMLNMLFGGIQATLSIKLLTWLTTLPDFSGGQVAKIGRSLQIAAGAFLGCILTISIVRFWLGSYTSSGNASSGIEGVIRTAMAALLIGLWPKLFGMGVALTNAFSNALLNDAAKDRLQHLFAGLDMASLGIPTAGAAAGGAVGLFVGAGISIMVWIIVSTASVVLFLGLIIMKIVVTAGTVIAFVAMPLALVLWPIPETSWVASMLAKAIAVLLAIPVIWILVFSAASAIGSDVFFLSNNGKNADFLGTGLNILLIKPLVACALLYMAIMLPSRLVKMVPLAGGAKVPGSGAARAVTNYATYAGIHSAANSAPVQAATAATKAGFKQGFNQPNWQPFAGGGTDQGEGWQGKIQDGAQKAGKQARQGFDKAKDMVGQKGGQAAGGAAGAYVAGPAGAAVGEKVGEKAGSKAASMVPSADQSASNGSRSDIPISKFESASAHQKNAQGGPLPTGSPDRDSKITAEHTRMNSMGDSDRPTQAQTQQAWDKLGASPSAQTAIQTVSAGSPNETPRELADWSTDTKNPSWGSQTEDATRVIGEASPNVRENVVTGGQGYGALGGTAASSGRQASGGQGGGGQAAGGQATPKPGGSTKPVPSATEGHKKPAMRQGES